MRFSTVCFVLLLVVVVELEAATCSPFIREKKLSELKHKLDQKLATSPLPPLASPPASSETKMVRATTTLHYFSTDFPPHETNDNSSN